MHDESPDLLGLTPDKTRRWSRLIVLGLVLTLGAGAAGYMVGRARTPGDLRDAQVVLTFPVQMEQFRDARQVAVSEILAETPKVKSGRAGVLTRSRCKTGSSLTSGTVAWFVNTHALMALYLAEPPYRDLSIGAKGHDVRVLQRQLRRLGESIAVTGHFNQVTLDGYNKLRKRAGLHPKPAFDRRDLVWLPSSRVTVQKCTATVGDRVVASAPLAMLQPRSATLKVKVWPDQLVAGARVFQIGAVEVPVDVKTHEVTRRHAVSQVLATPEAEAAAGSGTPELTGSLLLANPLQVASLPVGALVDGSSCVVGTDGGAVPVHRLSSSLGRIVVEFPAGLAPPSAVELDPPPDTRCS